MRKIISADCLTYPLQISRGPKANGSRPRTVVFTQGAEPTIVAVGGKISLFPVIKVCKPLKDTGTADVSICASPLWDRAAKQRGSGLHALTVAAGCHQDLMMQIATWPQMPG